MRLRGAAGARRAAAGRRCRRARAATRVDRRASADARAAFASAARSAPPTRTSCAAAPAAQSSPAIRGSPTGAATRSSRCAGCAWRPAGSTSARHPARVGRRGLEGMLPNRFPDAGDAPEFNAVDASLWFVVAVGELFDAAAARPGTLSTRASRSGCTRRSTAILEGYARRHALRHPHGRRRPARVRRARVAAHVDGRARRRSRDHAAHRQARGGPGAVAERAARRPAVDARWSAADRARAAGLRRAASGTPSRRALYDVVDVDHVPGRRRHVPPEPDLRGGWPAAAAARRRPRRGGRRRRRARLWTPLGLRSLAPGEPGYVGALRGVRAASATPPITRARCGRG